MIDIASREEHLIERARRGDSYAFSKLIAPYRRRLYAQIQKIVANPSDADDTMQETLICVFRGLENFRGEACFFTWVYRIAYNCSLSSRRRSAVLAMREEAQHKNDAEESCEAEGPESIVLGMQMAAAVDTALQSMNKEYQTAIILHEIDGLSYHEVADAMVCPVGTVKSRISKARSAIALKLKRCGFTQLPS